MLHMGEKFQACCFFALCAIKGGRSTWEWLKTWAQEILIREKNKGKTFLLKQSASSEIHQLPGKPLYEA